MAMMLLRAMAHCDTAPVYVLVLDPLLVSTLVLMFVFVLVACIYGSASVCSPTAGGDMPVRPG